jgi:fatty-acyl-CoA synthase
MSLWKPKTIGEMLDEVAQHFPDKPAVVCEDERVTFSELRVRARRVAMAFLALGLRRDEKVSLWLYNSLEWIFIQLGLGMIGGILVPINTRFKVSELTYTLQQSDSAILVTMDRFLNTDYAGMLYEAAPELRDAPPSKCRPGNFPHLRHVVCKGEGPYPGMIQWEEFLRLGEEVDQELLEARMDEVEPDQVAMIQYTSGTTSFPKGVMLTHDSILRDSHFLGERMTLSHEDSLFCPLPFFHVGGAVISTLLALQRGATLVTCTTYTPELSMEMIQRERCTAMNGIETHFIMIYQHPDFHRYDLGTLEKGWAIGPPEVIRSIYEKMGMRKILNAYGISEASPNVTSTCVDDPLEFRMHWHGRPQEGTEVKIVDYETGRDNPPGVEGEICVRGWNVMKGYYKKPQETKKAIDPQGWLHTGDSGVMDHEGNLRFTGRIKDIIRVGGENVSAMEVEGFLLTHPKVKNVAVIPAPDPRLTEVVMAVVQLKEGERATAEEIIDFCRDKIAGFKIPRIVRFVEEFPLTGSGKIQKFLLKERFKGDLGGPG